MKILDLAAGQYPYFYRFNISWNPEAEYFYFDSSIKNLRAAQEKIKKLANKPSDDKMNFLIGDSIKLPFENNYFDSIVVSNFLSAPIHWQWDEEKEEVKILSETGEARRPILKTPEQYDLFYNERKETVNEILRVIKPGGKIYLYTDLIVYGLASYKRILEELKNNTDLKYVQLIEEQKRIDLLNIEKKKIKSLEFCPCFSADVLPECEIYEFTKV